MAASALYSLLVIILPAHGVTFLWDDWSLLRRLVQGTRPGCWLEPVNQHWIPGFLGFLDLEHGIFGGRTFAYLLVGWIVHVANVALLGSLLRRRTGDARAAALASAAFGLAPTYRVILWWATGACVLLCFLTTAGAFLAYERSRDGDRRAPWLAMAAVLALVAPTTFGAGLAVAPVLALEAAMARPGRRARDVLVFLAVFCVSVSLYLAFAAGSAGEVAPRNADAWTRVLLFFGESVGLGFVQQVLFLPVREPIAGVALACGYAFAIAVAAQRASASGRARLIQAHAYLVLVVGLVASARWRYATGPDRLYASAHYQYMPGLVWTTVLALAIARLRRVRPRPTVTGALVGLGLLGAAHADAALRDRCAFAPRARFILQGRDLVEHVVAAASSASGPVFDGPVPHWLAWPDTRLSTVVAIVAPATRVRWTSERTEATIRPLVDDPVLRDTLPGLR